MKLKSACHQGEGGTLMTGGDIVPALATCVVIAMNLTLGNYQIS